MKKYVDKLIKLRGWVIVKHHIPGRIRLKYKVSIITQFGMFNTEKIDEILRDFPGIKKYKLSVATCSLLVEYDSNLIAPCLIDSVFSGSALEAEQACYKIVNVLRI
jgi:hypothetical protein